MIKTIEKFNNNKIYYKRRNDFFAKVKIISLYKRNKYKEIILFFKELILIYDFKYFLIDVKLIKSFIIIIRNTKLEYSLLLLLIPISSNAFGDFGPKIIIQIISGPGSPNKRIWGTLVKQ